MRDATAGLADHAVRLPQAERRERPRHHVSGRGTSNGGGRSKRRWPRRSFVLRPTVECDPYADGLRRWPALRWSTYDDGSRASWPADGHWAGTFASRTTPGKTRPPGSGPENPVRIADASPRLDQTDQDSPSGPGFHARTDVAAGCYGRRPHPCRRRLPPQGPYPRANDQARTESIPSVHLGFPQLWMEMWMSEGKS